MNISFRNGRMRTRRRSRYMVAAASLAVLALGATACSNGTSSSSSNSTTAPSSAAMSMPAGAAGTTEFMVSTSSKSFGDTVSALKQSVASAGMMVLGDLNQAQALTMTGLHLPGAQTFLVGNPTTGKMFFQTDPAVGAAIPVRMYVWQNTDGKTDVGYFCPGPMMTAINPKLADGGKKLTMMASKITADATGQAPARVGSAAAQFTTVTSSKSFDDTVAALKASIGTAGMMDMKEINQAQALTMTGLHLPGAQTLFVGNPTTGKMFFQIDPAAGMVVPLGIYVWQNTAGQTEIGYFNPAPLMTAVNAKLAGAGQKIAGVAATIVHSAAA